MYFYILKKTVLALKACNLKPPNKMKLRSMCVGGTLSITPITILLLRGIAEEMFLGRYLKNYSSISVVKRNFGSIEFDCAVNEKQTNKQKLVKMKRGRPTPSHLPVILP